MIEMNTFYHFIFSLSLLFNAVIIGVIICVANNREDIADKVADFITFIFKTPFFFILNKFRWCMYRIYKFYHWLRILPGDPNRPVWVGKEKEYLKRYAHD